jgi:GTP-binding protein LepA
MGPIAAADVQPAAVEPLEIGVFARHEAHGALEAGEVGYVATGLKTVRDCRVGDTITLAGRAGRPAAARLPAGQADGLCRPLPDRGEDYELLRDALEKLQLNDASLVYQPETSQALGFGFRCGFLGLFHMEIIQERLEREYDLDMVFTAPSVEYQVLKTDGETWPSTARPSCPIRDRDRRDREPWMQIRSLRRPSISAR